jgi:hypothetical protein
MGIGHKIRYTSKNKNRGSRSQVKGVEGIFDLSFAFVVVVEIILYHHYSCPQIPFRPMSRYIISLDDRDLLVERILDLGFAVGVVEIILYHHYSNSAHKTENRKRQATKAYSK